MEEWRVISKFPNYSVSNLGNVMNTKTGRIMRLNIKCGYSKVHLLNEKERKSIFVHRLVATYFIENPENKPEVNHKNKNRIDNRVENLEWLTKPENLQHKSIGLVYKTNRNKPILRIDISSRNILEKYESIDEAGIWVLNNGYTKTSHNGRNSIGNCLNGLSNSAYGFKWEYIKNDNLKNEEWREIDLKKLFGSDCFSDKKYFVSNLGRFKNSFGIIMENYKVNANGYIRVFIYKKTFALHRLVALTFLDNPENKEQVNHIDGNKLNNSLDNLEFVTNKENQIHKFLIGIGNNFTRAVKQYDLEGNFIKEYNSIVLAAKEMNISKSCITGVLLNKRKTAAGFIWKYSDDKNIDFSEKIKINKNIGRNVCQYDLDMNLIKTHNSIADASRTLNIHKNHIWAVINNFRKTTGGFIFKYLD